MKKITFISVLVLCGLIGVQAQNKLNLFHESGTAINIDAQRLNAADNEIAPKFTVTGKVLTAKNLEAGTQVDIYSVLGAKVYSFVYTGNPVVINLNKGIYIIRTEKYTQKIML